MSAEALKIAIYGKGGIGKSTIAANLAAAMSTQGARVLQIGCDPKQDSTRLLVGGRPLTTVLDYLKTTHPLSRKLEDVVATGYGGVACVEAGGPEPGVGCAGRGILSTFDLLEKLNIGSLECEATLYDVLGDVVCGGFAVPLRSEYANAVYIVTSGEFMALYAANNILRGVRNFESNGPRIGGLILNRRGLDDEEARVARFAKAIQLPIVGVFPRSELFAQAERAGKLILETHPDGDLADAFRKLSQYMLHGPRHFAAKPLASDDLESVVLGTANAPVNFASRKMISALQSAHSGVPAMAASLPVRVNRYYSKGVRDHAILFGCAFNGAAHTALQLPGAVVVAHGPQSCSFLSELSTLSAMRRSWRRHGVRTFSAAPGELISSDMDERVVIFGGNEGLEDALQRAMVRKPSVIFLVTTCSAGIIGDDVKVSLARLKETLNRTPVVVVPADGDLSGDYSQGVLDISRMIAERFIDPNVQPEDLLANVVGEKNLVNQTDSNFHAIESLLGELGVRVNCRFIRQCAPEQLKGFQRASLNLPAYNDLFGRTLRDFLVERYHARFVSAPFPVGFRQTEQWLREVGEAFSRRELAEEVANAHRQRYAGEIALLRPSLESKRIFIVSQNRHLDWVLDTALDAGMEIVRVGLLDSTWDDEIQTRYAQRIPFVAGYKREQRMDDIRELKPDLMLTDSRWHGAPDDLCVGVIPFTTDVGFYGGVAQAERWRDLLWAPAKEAWRYDLQ